MAMLARRQVLYVYVGRNTLDSERGELGDARGMEVTKPEMEQSFGGTGGPGGGRGGVDGIGRDPIEPKGV